MNKNMFKIDQIISKKLASIWTEETFPVCIWQ